MGSSSSASTTNTTNVTNTSTTDIANSFNNALNTTQNFQNIGGYTPAGGMTFGSTNYTIIIAAIAAFVAFWVLMKR